jgi:hypothetical protein
MLARPRFSGVDPDRQARHNGRHTGAGLVDGDGVRVGGVRGAMAWMKRIMWAWVVAVAMGSAFAGAETFPSRPLRIIVPFPPGAAADAAVRIVAQRMSLYMHQPVLVRNHPGVPGVLVVAQAAPDGYTLLLGTGSIMVTQPLLVQRLVYSPSDFAAVGRILMTTPVLTTHPGVGVSTIPELLGKGPRRARSTGLQFQRFRQSWPPGDGDVPGLDRDFPRPYPL